MNPILIKKYLKSEYVFYPNLVQRIKKGKIVKEIMISDIEEIIYNEKFGFVDFIKILIDRLHPYFNFPKSFVIILKAKPHVFSIQLKKEEYEILKESFLKTITLI